MRSIKAGLLGCLVVCFLGTAAVVGCSASGDSGDAFGPATEQNPTDGSGGTTLPPSSGDDDPEPTKDGGKKDGGSKDAGKADAAKDAGAPPPAEGAACTTVNQIFKRDCGTCGKQEAICLPNDSGTGGTVSPYGECTNQVVNGCTPGTQETIACGNCGTQIRTCNNFCSWSNAACTGQPANSCTPGSIELVSAGCAANTYRQKECSTACQWGGASANCEAPPTFVLVPPTVGSVNSTVTVLSDTNKVARLGFGSTCPITSALATTITPYSYIEVRNTNAKAVTVSIYNSQVTGGPIIDTVMTAYAGTAIPSTEAERKACTGQVNDFGDDALTGDSDFASIKNIQIPANSSVQVYTASYYDGSGSSPATGMIKVNVKVDSIAP